MKPNATGLDLPNKETEYYYLQDQDIVSLRIMRRLNPFRLNYSIRKIKRNLDL